MAITLLRTTGWRIRWARAQTLIGYSWPLIGAGLLGLYLTAGNRVVLSRTHGLDDLGLLALASQLALVMRSLVWQPFNQAWGPQRFRLIQTDGGRATYQRAFTLVIVVLCGAGTALAVFAEEFIELMSAPAFHEAATLVPILIGAEILRCMALFANTPLLVSDRTIEMLKSSIIGAVVFTVALVFLVPRWGATGAAFATLINASITLLWIASKARIQIDLRLPWWKFLLALGLALSAMLASQLAPEALVAGMLAKTLVLSTFCLCIFVSPVITQQERQLTLAFVRSALRRSSSQL